MTFLIIGFVLAFVVPMFIGSWRAGFVGLAVQTMFLAGIVALKAEGFNASAIIRILDLAVIRGVFVPLYITSAIAKNHHKPEFDFLPTNFLYWTGLFFFLGAGFYFGQVLFPGDTQRMLHVGAASCGVLVALFVLSSQSSGISQIFSILLLESSVMMFELLSPHELNPLAQFGSSLVFVSLIVVSRIFLVRLPILESAQTAGPEKGDII